MSTASERTRPTSRLPFIAVFSLLLPRTWREGRREGMIEHRPLLTFITHAVLILGVAILAFPVYVTVVASTGKTTVSTTSVEFSMDLVSLGVILASVVVLAILAAQALRRRTPRESPLSN